MIECITHKGQIRLRYIAYYGRLNILLLIFEHAMNVEAVVRDKPEHDSVECDGCQDGE